MASISKGRITKITLVTYNHKQRVASLRLRCYRKMNDMHPFKYWKGSQWLGLKQLKAL